MRTSGSRLWLALAITLGSGVAISSAARAGDIADIVVDLVRPLETGAISTIWNCQFDGYCVDATDTIFDADEANVSLSGLDLSSLSSVTSGVVNDRIVPLSSSVSGFTYDYNPDLDVYDRSTKTFGPLFSERAQTIGKKRFLVGLSQSYLEFDQFDGNNLDSTSLSELGGSLQTSDADGSFPSGTLVSQRSQLSQLTSGQVLDIDLDVSIKEWVSTAYFTYGLTERIDVGVVLPLMTIKAKASAQTVAGDSPLPGCLESIQDDILDSPLAECIGSSSGATSYNSDSETHTGIGDLVVRGKWNFFVGMANAALTAEATIPTGDPDNLTGLHTMTYRPGLVVSKDFETPMGGLGLQSYVGYNFRPDEPEQQEFDWAVGAALQPFGRASISLDLIGSNETRGAENFLLDGSVGLKLMLAQNLLLDFNWIAPLNDDGLRPSAGIFTLQFEGTFGD